MLIMDPRWGPGAMVGEGHAPVVAVLVRAVRQTSSLRPPKGMDPGLCGISPANQPFKCPPEGAMIAAMDPRQAAARW
jgi:hypothetical protein